MYSVLSESDETFMKSNPNLKKKSSKKSNNLIYSIDTNKEENNLVNEKIEEYDEINIISIINTKNEANKLALILAPLLWNFKLDIVVINGGIYNRNSSATISKHSFKCSNDKLTTVPTVTLCYNYSHYDILYSKDYFKANENVFTQILKWQSKIINPIHYYINSFEGFCKECAGRNEEVIFTVLALKICKSCLFGFIDKTVKERAIYFNKENCNSRECNYILTLLFRLLFPYYYRVQNQ